jgi:hypothetical protein
MHAVPLSALDEKMLACEPGGYPWDEWRQRALAAGIDDALAWLGRGVMREAYNHDWSERLRHECGWSDEGATMLELALAQPGEAARRWEWLLSTDGGSYFGNVNHLEA